MRYLPLIHLETITRLNENDREYEKFFNWKVKQEILPTYADVNYHSWMNLPCVLCDKAADWLDRGIGSAVVDVGPE